MTKRIKLSAIILSVALLLCTLCSCSAEKLVLEREEEFHTLLDEINHYRPGTLGSSLKICNVALAFLDFAEEAETIQEELLVISARGYLAALYEEEIEFFKETVEEVKLIATQIFEDGIESMEGRISDAGNRNRHESYTREKYEALMSIFDKILSEQ